MTRRGGVLEDLARGGVERTKVACAQAGAGGGEGDRGNEDEPTDHASGEGSGSDPAASLARPMPIYEYKCPNGHLFEVFHGMTEPGPEVCEVCGAEPLQRVLHPVAVHYKGSGFYSTDYGRSRRRAARATARVGDVVVGLVVDERAPAPAARRLAAPAAASATRSRRTPAARALSRLGAA